MKHAIAKTIGSDPGRDEIGEGVLAAVGGSGEFSPAAAFIWRHDGART